MGNKSQIKKITLKTESENMKITFTKRTIKRLEKTVKTALKLNNLRLFKLAKSLLMVAEGYSIDHISNRPQVFW